MICADCREIRETNPGGWCERCWDREEDYSYSEEWENRNE